MTEARNLHQRLAAVMGEVSYIQKERKNGMNYTIVSHDKVTAKVRPALLKHGVIYYPVACAHAHSGNRAECDMTVRFANIDNPSDFINVPTFGYGVDNQDKGPGKAMSYAVKYALLKALGLETGDDADNESIDHTCDDPAQVEPEDVAEFRARIAQARSRSTLNAIGADLKTARPEIGKAVREQWKNRYDVLPVTDCPLDGEAA